VRPAKAMKAYLTMSTACDKVLLVVCLRRWVEVGRGAGSRWNDRRSVKSVYKHRGRELKAVNGWSGLNDRLLPRAQLAVGVREEEGRSLVDHIYTPWSDQYAVSPPHRPSTALPSRAESSISIAHTTANPIRDWEAEVPSSKLLKHC
jgi:hypothetical protein